MKWISPIGFCVLAVLVAPFAWHALARGVAALAQDSAAFGWLHTPGAPLANAAIFAHMITGAIVTLTAPLQVLPIVRRKWPRLHRRSGYVLATTAVLTGIGGLIYIALQGTIGGWWMSLWFAIYGLLMIWAAAQTVYFAIDKDIARHRRWGLRLLVLAVGSFLYRVHYGLWFATMGRVGVAKDFGGPFDLVQVWAFYLPYLALLELYFRYERRRAKPVRVAA